ncbi:C-1-tetrahydrofolate synthase, cytoplasmic [Hondaea fermentalgiana]|uniref:formate--tetrahydrofolate ligase n=1 Tax=Hondaea fermentalgiana TaxID=2315210 RepID=A0A2R5H038_9STRA|nr:C-1-tetrahydrofolate synthase, cytoplasmic [Hondaea fermentalgiana]|eukprot:GBG34101.1 C-1-tetrahydrofolate synthase, cytoplasmic [Hondaea fermentalgiana]
MTAMSSLRLGAAAAMAGSRRGNLTVRMSFRAMSTSQKAPDNPDERIALAAELKPIHDVLADRVKITDPDSYALYGRYKAKLDVNFAKQPAKGKLVLVTALTPTKAGEGKTCTSVGLADGLNKLPDTTAIAALREPSLGPVFGVKGGAAGGGYAQVVPMADINLHFTGDLHAISTAHNLLSAMIDNHIQWNAKPQLDVRRVEWGRVLDMNDRALRNVTLGLGGTGDGVPRQSFFDITVASEVMAIFCLATDLEDLKTRLGNIVVGYTRGGKEAVTCRDIGAEGAMTALLKDAFNPNVVQTLEHNLAVIHGGPFANIAHGCSSVVGTRAALALSDYVVTEGGFGADLGAEKFFDIKCRKAGLAPSAAVIVATVRALKLHGGVDAKELTTENTQAVRDGMPNLLRHIENVAKFGVESVVSINRFPTDTEAEIQVVKDLCKELGVDAVVAEQWQHGGEGALELAKAVQGLCDKADTSKFKPLYPDEMPLVDKISTIATELYRAKGVDISKEALTKLKRFQKDGYGHLPVCIAKTQYSFSDDASLVNAPEGHTLHVQDVRLAAGAEFVVVLTGSVMTMPGLPKRPSALDITVNENGQISGLF